MALAVRWVDHRNLGFSPGAPWLKPLCNVRRFAGLKPGASTAIIDIAGNGNESQRRAGRDG